MDEENFEELAGDITVERSISLPADPDSLWEHLTDGHLVGDWMEGDVEIDARPGGRITMTPEEGPVVWGTVEDIVPEDDSNGAGAPTKACPPRSRSSWSRPRRART